MPDYSDRVDALLQKVEDFAAASPPGCEDEVADLKAAAKGVDLAEDNLEAVEADLWLTSGTTGAATVGIAICLLGAETGVILVGCIVAGVGGIVGGGGFIGQKVLAQKIAEKQLDAALDTLERAVEKLCRCWYRQH